jgi:hypothetical protein
MSVRDKPARRVRTGLSVASMLLAVGLLTLVLPRLLGVGWAEIVATLRGVPVESMVVLVALWLAGLLAYTFVVTATLPTMSAGRAFRMNAAGAADGQPPAPRRRGRGAAHVRHGAGLGPRTGVCGRVGCGVEHLERAYPAAVASCRAGGSARLRHLAGHGDRRRSCRGCGRLRCRCGGPGRLVLVGRDRRRHGSAGRLRRATAPGADPAGSQPVGNGLRRLRHEIVGTVRRRWVRLTLAMAATTVLQGVLFAACLHVSGANPACPRRWPPSR